MEIQDLDKIVEKLNVFIESDDIRFINEISVSLGKPEVLKEEEIKQFEDNPESDDAEQIANVFMKNLKKIIKDIEESLNDEEKEYFYNKLDINYIPFISNDNKKIELLDKIDYWVKIEVIKSLNSDEKKIECLNQLEADGSKVEVIKSLNGDEKKIKCLNQLESDGSKAEVITSLSSDKKKIEALYKLSDSSAKVEVITSLSNDEKKVEYFNQLLNNIPDGPTKEYLRLCCGIENFESKNKYDSFGLPKDMTIGIEIEAERRHE